jgi:hypothetical protein
MATNDTRRLTIYFNDGNQIAFAFERQTDITLIVQLMKEALDKQLLVVELEDRVMAIPFSSVQRLEVRPRPEKLPPYAIRGARLLG